MSCVVSFPDLRRGARDSGPKLWPSSRENRGKEERREERGERRGKEKRENRKEKGQMEEAIRLDSGGREKRTS
jgi:hypothetical protein